MKINKDTKICFSLASQPGNFGATVHNYCYKKLGLNYIYIPLSTSNLETTINWMRATPNVVGCSISTPYKKEVLKYVDLLKNNVSNNINTIVKSNEGFLIGYSTDVFAIENIVKSNNFTYKKVCILGNGAMSNNFLNIIFPNYSRNVVVLDRKKINEFKFEEKFDIVINATSIGMKDNEFFENSEIGKLFYHANFIIDCPVNMNKTMIDEFLSENDYIIDNNKIKYINGINLSLLQASKQFEKYTGIKQEEVYPLMKEALNDSRT